eukprot:GGOE01000720.1.p1 GENE.GGOE01000720.1~~GGOE01000720.1.p1  ORF type:complete len:469 (-),score=130.91 GGOE01000720.1:42-1448(-)
MPIRAVLFAEFDVEKGPIISHCYPHHYVDERLQQQLKNLLIPKPILYNHKMCFSFDNLLFIGHPMCIKGHKYKRNELLFNLVLVVEQAEDEPSTPYITALEKLAGSLRQLEDMDGWVWKQSKQWDGKSRGPPTSTNSSVSGSVGSPVPSVNQLPSSVATDTVELRALKESFAGGTSCQEHRALHDAGDLPICAILERIFTDLNRRGRVVLPITPSNIMTVRLQERHEPVPQIKCHEVPVVIHEPDCCHQFPDWDMACEVVKGCVDGQKHVRLIAETLGMEVKHVQMVLGILQRYRIIGMLDVFQFSNRYVVTHKLADFSPHATDQTRRRALQCALESCLLPAGPPNFFERLLRFYSLMTPDCEEPIAKLAAQSPPEIDLKRAVQFGVLHGILQRVHDWPVVPSAADVAAIVAGMDLEPPDTEVLADCLRGKQCMDAICVALRCSRQRLLDLLHPHLEVQRCFIICKPG